MNNNNIMQLKEVINFGKPVHKEDHFTYYLQNSEAIVDAFNNALSKGIEDKFSMQVLVRCQNNDNASEVYNEFYKASFKPHKDLGLRGSFDALESETPENFAIWLKFEKDAEGDYLA